MLKKILIASATLVAAMTPAWSQTIVDANKKIIGSYDYGGSRGLSTAIIKTASSGFVAVPSVYRGGFAQYIQGNFYTLPACQGEAYNNIGAYGFQRDYAVPLAIPAVNVVGLLKNAGNDLYYRVRIDYVPLPLSTVSITAASYGYQGANGVVCLGTSTAQIDYASKIISQEIQFTPPFTLK